MVFNSDITIIKNYGTEKSPRYMDFLIKGVHYEPCESLDMQAAKSKKIKTFKAIVPFASTFGLTIEVGDMLVEGESDEVANAAVITKANFINGTTVRNWHLEGEFV